MSDHIIVEKFGGGGSQSPGHIERNVQHIVDEPSIAACVFSGPGGISGRATERVINLTDAHARGLDTASILSEIYDQFSAVTPVSAQHLVGPAMDEIKSGLENGHGYGRVKAQPEFFMRNVYAFLLDQAGVEVNALNPVGSVFADERGRLDSERTISSLAKSLRPNVLNLIPGFSAMDPSGNMVNLGRGSSDIVAAITARTYKFIQPDARVDLVLRKDDVNGILRASPKIISDAEVADELSIAEVEALALGGAEVVHSSVMSLMEGFGVRILVKNTFNMDHPGTTIVPQNEREIDVDKPVSGIASKPVAGYEWHSAPADTLPGSIEAVSGVFTKLGISISDIQSSPGGSITVYIGDDLASKHNIAILEGLGALSESSAKVSTRKGLEEVVMVGEALRDSYTKLKVVAGLVETTEAGATEVADILFNGSLPNVSVVVPSEDSERFIQKLYAQHIAQ